MSLYKEIYKLYKCTRCYGANINRENCIKEYVMENTNMDILINFVKNLNEEKKKEYTFCIQKIRNNHIMWRQLSMRDKRCWSNYTFGDITSTWEKYILDKKKQKWRTSNYRYSDEIISRLA